MKTPARAEVFRGHLKECLTHLGNFLESQIPLRSEGAAQAREPVSRFCQVSTLTVRRWLNRNGHVPWGDSLLKAYCYLDMIGYRIIEFEKFKKTPGRFMIVELIGYSVLTCDEAVKLVGYDSRRSLFGVLQGHRATSPEKEQSMWEIGKNMKRELEMEKKKAAVLYSLTVPAELLPTPEAPLPIPQVTIEVRPTIRAPQGAAIFKFIEALDGLLDEQSTYDSLLAYLVNGPPFIVHSTLRLSKKLQDMSARLYVPIGVTNAK